MCFCHFTNPANTKHLYNICTFDVDPTLYKWYTNVLRLLGSDVVSIVAGFCPIIQVTGTNRHKSVVGFYLLFPGLFCSLKPVYQLSNSKGSFYIYFFKSDLVAITGWAVGDAPCNNTFVLIRESPVEPYLPAKQPWKEIKRKGGTTKNSDINVVCGGKVACICNKMIKTRWSLCSWWFDIHRSEW